MTTYFFFFWEGFGGTPDTQGHVAIHDRAAYVLVLADALVTGPTAMLHDRTKYNLSLADAVKWSVVVNDRTKYDETATDEGDPNG